jgi:hypothetical protein
MTVINFLNLQEEVEKLYYLRDHYYDSLQSESPQDQKWNVVKKEMLAIVGKIKSLYFIDGKNISIILIPSTTNINLKI